MRKIFSLEEIEFLKKEYVNTSNSNLAERLGCKTSSIEYKSFQLGLKKSKEYLASLVSEKFRESSKKYVFEKGQVPKNKGKKMDDYLSIETKAKVLKTTFKKGNVPKNTKEKLEISIRNCDGKQYKFIKLENKNWIPLHVHIWEQNFGKVPLGHIVVFKDKNTSNLSIDNLALISRIENMQRNSIHNYPPEIIKTIKTLTKLKKKIYGKKQDKRS